MDAKAEALVVKKCQWRAGDVVVLVLLGLLLGQFILMSGSKPVWTDEIYTHYIAAVGGFRDIYQTLLGNSGDGNPPLFFFIVHAFISLFGDHPLVLRMPSILSMVMSLWLFHRLVRRYASAWVTVLMVGMVSLTHLPFFAVEARAYAFVILCGMVSLWAWVRYDETQNWRWIIVLAIGLIAGVYSHYYAVTQFAVVAGCEFLRNVRTRTLRLPFWIGLFLACVSVLGLLPLIAVFSGYRDGFHYAPVIANLKASLVGWTFFPNMQIGLLLFVIGAMLAWAWLPWSESRLVRGVSDPARLAPPVLGLALCALVPFLGYAMALAYTNAFYASYVVINVFATVGMLALLMGMLPLRWLRVGGVMFLAVVGLQSATVIRETFRNQQTAVPADSRMMYDWLDRNKGVIHIGSGKDFIESYYHAVPEDRARLVWIWDHNPASRGKDSRFMPESSFCQTFGLPIVSLKDLLDTGDAFTIYEPLHFPSPELKDAGREWVQVSEHIFQVQARDPDSFPPSQGQ